MADSPNKLKNFIQNPILQTFAIFISSSWIVLEITDYFIENFGLNESARKILLIILLALLPVAVFLAWYLTRQTGTRDTAHVKPVLLFKRRRVVIPVIFLVAAAGISMGLRFQHNARIESALQVTLPGIREDMQQVKEYDGVRNWEVFEKARELKKVLRNHPEFHQLWNDIVIQISITTDPEEAAIYARSYGGPDTAWHYLGNSPLEGVALPRGLSQIKLEKPGFVTAYDLVYTKFTWPAEFEPRQYTLHRPDEVP